MTQDKLLEDAVEGAIGFAHQALGVGYRPGNGALRVLDHLGARPCLDGAAGGARQYPRRPITAG